MLFLLAGFRSICQDLVRSIYFEPGSYTVDKKYASLLNELVSYCNSDSISFLKLFAFTDTTGSKSFNEQLAKKRCDAVLNHLLKHSKIDTAHIYATWLGESPEIYALQFPDKRRIG